MWVASFLQPPAARAGTAHYDGWFHTRIDQAGLEALCDEGPDCDLDAHPFLMVANSSSTIEDWEFGQLFLAAVMVASAGVTADDSPETWACVLPPAGIPADGQSAESTGLEGQRLGPDVVVLGGNLDYDADDWPTYFGVCLMMAMGFAAAACCFHLVQRGDPPPLSGDPYVQGDDSPRQIFVADAGEPCPPHVFSQLAGLGKPAYRFGQIGVGIAAAGKRAPNPREYTPRVEVI